MNIDKVTGVLEGVRFSPSPNHDEYPCDDAGVELIVIHNISLPPGEFGGNGIEDLFLNRLDPEAHPYYSTIAEMKVSAHLLIRRDGEMIQFVPFNKRAWHAGVSCYSGREGCNDFSIGIELEGDDVTSFTSEQYEKLGEVTRTLMTTYSDLSAERVVGHCDIAPGRKTDPGDCFDWGLYREGLL